MAGIDEKTEAVARVLCEHAGKNPDGHYNAAARFYHCEGRTHLEMVQSKEPNWKCYVNAAVTVLIAAGVEFT